MKEFFSQNFEDVILRRCFKDVEDGFYIDVGAQREEADSVTKHFYLSGWTGVNIEPVDEYFQELVKGRPRDVNLKTAVGDVQGVAFLQVAKGSGLSSFLEDNAQLARNLGFQVESTPCNVTTLSAILDNIEDLPNKIHFLKIDVEGYELKVLKGLDFSRYRPLVILAEVTLPSTWQPHQDLSTIEELLAGFSYQSVYFDGLNQWWVAEEVGSDLKSAFSRPVGIHDGYGPSAFRGLVAERENEAGHLRQQVAERENEAGHLRQQVAERENEAGHLRQQVAERENEAGHLRQQVAERENELEVVYRSVSWRVTAPLRFTKRVIDHLRLADIAGAPSVRFATRVQAAILHPLSSEKRREFRKAGITSLPDPNNASAFAKFYTNVQAAILHPLSSEKRRAFRKVKDIPLPDECSVKSIDLALETQSVRLAYKRLVKARANEDFPAEPQRHEIERLRLAYVSPLPPEYTGIAKTPTVFQGFWHGPALGPLRQACLNSFIQKGHLFELYTYDHVNVPIGVVLKSAEEIIPFSEVFYYDNPQTGIKDLGPFSDLFRFKLLSERGGWWSDVDTICLSPYIPMVDRAWAQELPEFNSAAVGTSQLAMRKGDPLAVELYARCLTLSRSKLPQRESLGPRLLSSTIRDMQLPLNVFGSPATFYPIRWIEMFKLWLPDFLSEIDERCHNSLFMPIYQSFPQYIGLTLGKLPPPGSFLAEMCSQYLPDLTGAECHLQGEILEGTRAFLHRNAHWAFEELRAVGGPAALSRLGLPEN